MSNTVVSVLPNRQQAERAVDELRRQGFEQEISIIKDDSKSENERLNMGETDSITDGATTGEAI